jgi:hypothetical protein
MTAADQGRDVGPPAAARQSPAQPQDQVDLGQNEDDRQKDHGEACQDQQHLAERCLHCIHRDAPLVRAGQLPGSAAAAGRQLPAC